MNVMEEHERHIMINSHKIVNPNCNDDRENPVIDELDDHESQRLVVISDAARLGVAAILKGLLNRLALLSSLPEAHDISDTSIKIDKNSENYDIAKSRLLESAKLALNRVGDKSKASKLSKFMVEASWLRTVLTSILEEVQNNGTLSSLFKVNEEHDANASRISASLGHMKSLKSEMHTFRQLIHSESVSHKDVINEWRRSHARLRQAIKDLKKENKMTYKFRLDIAVAENDCKRRVREERLKVLKDEINHLGDQLEMEKRANCVCAEFLKKQSVEFMEEAISTAAARDNDIYHMDMMLHRLKEQKQKKEKLLSVLEPRYEEEMAQSKAAPEALQNGISIEEQRDIEVITRASIKIQKIWRGHMVRLLYNKESKKTFKRGRKVKAAEKKI